MAVLHVPLWTLFLFSKYMITSRTASVRQKKPPQLWPFWRRDYRCFLMSCVLSASLHLICITTITLENNHSKINDTAAVFLPPPSPHPAPQHPPLLASTLPSLPLFFIFLHSPSLLFFFLRQSLSQEITSFSVHNRYAQTNATLFCECQCMSSFFNKYLLVWSLCVWLYVPVWTHISVCMWVADGYAFKHIYL